jgi:hypothetical protein
MNVKPVVVRAFFYVAALASATWVGQHENTILMDALHEPVPQRRARAAPHEDLRVVSGESPAVPVGQSDGAQVSLLPYYRSAVSSQSDLTYLGDGTIDAAELIDLLKWSVAVGVSIFLLLRIPGALNHFAEIAERLARSTSSEKSSQE